MLNLKIRFKGREVAFSEVATILMFPILKYHNSTKQVLEYIELI